MTTGPKFSFSHLGIYAENLPKMEDFYTRIIGLTITDRGELPTPGGVVSLIFFSSDPDEHHQFVLATGRPPNLPFSLINQISLRARDLDALKTTLSELRQEGITYLDTVTHGNALSIYTRDPEGNRLELFIDLPWYVTQPKRDDFDLSGSNEDILARAEKHARAQPGFIPRAVWREQMAQRMGLS
jgi:catechol 2,3-dioxygenase-like lactoylglutathione lyase family enzyme